MGGIHTEIHLPRRRRGQRNNTSSDIIAAVRLLVPQQARHRPR
jgi:hypothetical protein